MTGRQEEPGDGGVAPLKQNWMMPLKAGSLDFASLVSGRLVVVACPPRNFESTRLVEDGARGVLTLSRKGARADDTLSIAHLKGTFTRPSDVARNNCSVAILFGAASFVLTDKRYFGGFDHLLVSTGGAFAAGGIGLARYGGRGLLRAVGFVHRPGSGNFIVFENNTKRSIRSRAFGPSGVSLRALLTEMGDLDYILLRSIDGIEAESHTGDVDILVAAEMVEAFRERISKQIGTQPFDIYTPAAELGYSYRGVPCFKPAFARKILESAEVRESGLRVPSPKWRYLAFVYHVLFHNKLTKTAAQASVLTPELLRKPRHYQALVESAVEAGYEIPSTIADLENALHAEDAFPGIDLLAFYGQHSVFVRQRYLDAVQAPPGLAVFFVRDFGESDKPVAAIRDLLYSRFTVLAEGPVTDLNRETLIRSVRGGNWHDVRGPRRWAPPVYWFVCWDEKPKRPSVLMRRRYPRLDNANLRFKTQIRKALGASGSNSKPLGIVHASDNTAEALEHLEHLGLDQQATVRLRGLTTLS